jgi:hypothetical protein
MEAVTVAPPPAGGRMLGDRSERGLVARVRAGEDAAFEALFDCYHRSLRALCHHMLGSREEAEDVVQHTFLAAYRGLCAGDDVVGLKPSLYTIARNRCLSVLRARREDVGLDDSAWRPRGWQPRLTVAPPCACSCATSSVLRPISERRSCSSSSATIRMRRSRPSSASGAQKVKALVFQARETLMGLRAARETPCAHVREQLATLTGSALRGSAIRRHVEQCAGCAQYEAEVRSQRAALAIVLPVAPAAGLKAAVLGLTLGGSGVTTAVGAGATTSPPAISRVSPPTASRPRSS